MSPGWEYQWADIFVLPCVKSQTGEHDITPNVILEAMALELPVVSTISGAIPEIVSNRESGLLVPPKDVHALVEAMQSLMQNPDLRKKYGAAGRRQVMENYNIAKNFAQMAAIFNKGQN